MPGSELEIEAVCLNPTRTQFLTTLRALRMRAEITEAHDECNEPVGTVRVSGSQEAEPRQHGVSNSVGGALIPQLIDELPLLAVVGSQIEGGIEIRNAKELRVKESDRIASTVAGLRSMGCEVEEFDDGLRVAGPTRLRGAKINPQGDHRIAMAFTVAALMAEGDSEIEGADCVAVSFPEFFDLLESVVR